MGKRIGLFVEDYGHETVLNALIQRYAHTYGTDVEIQSRSVRGGHGRMISELRQYLRDSHDQPREESLDVVIIARDANCKGVQERRRELEEIVRKQSVTVTCLYAIPDPHIERWLLLDSNAFKTVLGRGCQAPDLKCERGRYKRLLSEAVRAAGIVPIVHGMEHAEALINDMDFQRIMRQDTSFGQLLQDLTTLFTQWSHEGEY